MFALAQICIDVLSDPTILSLSAVCVVQFFMRRRARNGLFGFGHTKPRWPNDLILHKTRPTALAV
jgi:hypothetical protein